MPKPVRDEDLLELLRAYLREPRTVSEIRKVFNVSGKTIYRYLNYLGPRVSGRRLGNKETYYSIKEKK